MAAPSRALGNAGPAVIQESWVLTPEANEQIIDTTDSIFVMADPCHGAGADSRVAKRS
jgi:hypothetical protein